MDHEVHGASPPACSRRRRPTLLLDEGRRGALPDPTRHLPADPPAREGARRRGLPPHEPQRRAHRRGRVILGYARARSRGGRRHARRAGGDLRPAARPACGSAASTRPARTTSSACSPTSAARTPRSRSTWSSRRRTTCSRAYAPTSWTARSPRVDPDALGDEFAARCCGRRRSSSPSRATTRCARSRQITFEELAAEDLIAYRDNSALRRRLERTMADARPRAPQRVRLHRDGRGPRRSRARASASR